VTTSPNGPCGNAELVTAVGTGSSTAGARSTYSVDKRAKRYGRDGFDVGMHVQSPWPLHEDEMSCSTGDGDEPIYELTTGREHFIFRSVAGMVGCHGRASRDVASFFSQNYISALNDGSFRCEPWLMRYL